MKELHTLGRTFKVFFEDSTYNSAVSPESLSHLKKRIFDGWSVIMDEGFSQQDNRRGKSMKWQPQTFCKINNESTNKQNDLFLVNYVFQLFRGILRLQYKSWTISFDHQYILGVFIEEFELDTN